MSAEGLVQRLVDELVELRAGVEKLDKGQEELRAEQRALVAKLKAVTAERDAGLERVLDQAAKAVIGHYLSREVRDMAAGSEGLGRAMRELQALRHDLAAERVAWWPRLYWAAGGGAAAMALLLALVVKAVGVDRLYAMPHGGDRVEAAAQLFQRASPAYYEQLLAAHKLLQGPAGEGLAACMADAGKKGKPVKCTLTMAPPQVAQKN